MYSHSYFQYLPPHGTFVVIEPTQTCHCHPEPVVAFESTPGIKPPLGLDKRMTYIPWQGHTSQSTAPKSFVLC
jgi:hypothetical protein